MKSPYGGEATGWVGAGGVLDVFTVFCDQSWSELLQCGTKLGRDVLANKILGRFFVEGGGVKLYFELQALLADV